MTIYLITRHPGAVEWMKIKGRPYDIHLTHLTDYDAFHKGDTVVGSLPINVVADLNKLGVDYIHLNLYVPESLRGVELSAEQLVVLNATLEPYRVLRLNDPENTHYGQP